MRLGDRSLFPDLHGIYLNHAGVSPASRPVQGAALAPLLDNAAHGAGAFPRWIEQRQRLKGKLATLLGATATDLALVPGTTYGLVDLALCMPWRTGDRILCLEGEFPTNVTPWQQAARSFGLQLDFLPVAPFHEGVDAGLAALRDALRTPTRLVAVSAVQFQTGLRMPLAEMADACHAAGAQIVVDAIQAVGVVPFSVGSIDYAVGGAHKWLMGVEGAGWVYARPERAAALVPRVAGWLSHEDPVRFLFEGPGQLRTDRPVRTSIDFLERGVPNTIGFAALEASVNILAGLGVPAIHAHVQAFHDVLEPELRARGFTSARTPFAEGRSGTLSVRPPAPHTHASLGHALSAAGIHVATPDGWLRFSPHWPNDVGQIPAVLDAVDAALRTVPTR